MAVSSLPGQASAELRKKLNLPGLGVNVDDNVPVFHNLSYEDIHTHETTLNEGTQIDNGTVSVDTGKGFVLRLMFTQ